MARTIEPKKLIDTLEKLVAQRTALLEQIAESQAELEKIDSLFSDYGLSVTSPAATGAKGRRGRRSAAKAAKAGKVAKGGKGKAGKSAGRRSRGSFAKTAEESIIDFVKKHDRPSTADVNKHWQGEGRGGKADNTLTKMVKNGQLKRIKDESVRGSCYEVA